MTQKLDLQISTSFWFETWSNFSGEQKTFPDSEIQSSLFEHNKPIELADKSASRFYTVAVFAEKFWPPTALEMKNQAFSIDFRSFSAFKFIG